MDFSLDHRDPLKSTYTSTNDNVPLYKVNKHSGDIEVHKLVNGQHVLMAKIEQHIVHSDKVLLWGKEIGPINTSGWTGSIQFPGSDGSPYKWKKDGSDFKLHDKSKQEVATFDHGHKAIFHSSHNRLPVLHIHSDGVQILDETIAMFMYMVKKTQDDDRRKKQSTITNAASASATTNTAVTSTSATTSCAPAASGPSC
ncbi:hypothetical protein K435DRAFT_861172 [Dendrothele bispora CBS 962.96]|uniref:DUF6593 domain-containing protein n=1 Tax=Dendrothele bispora (strain CBS 962.96) TaxID=1314807 RepID=A0A4S8LW04_DENBC|nr:hypothetical protein K435DRAFT_861172 [Dendrothele bispora CBS 962.96]